MTDFLACDDVVDQYLSGADIEAAPIAFNRMFGFFKLAADAQAIPARHRLGGAVGEELSAVAGAVDVLMPTVSANAQMHR
jgi:hypothetical protein